MRRSKWILALCITVVVAATTAGVAYAHITATTGSVAYLSSPPASVRLNALESSSQVQSFDERQGITLASPVTVDALVTPSTTFPLQVTSFPSGNATIPTGTLVDSHLIHSDIPNRNYSSHRTGTLTFANNIVGVIASTSRLASSDSALGAPTTLYAGTTQWRGLEGGSENGSSFSDRFTITGARTLSFDVNTLVMDEIRVITKHNSAPTAGNDSYVTNSGTNLSVNAASGVLFNDSDPDGPAPLSAVLVGTPSKGGMTFNSDGSFTYSPNANATGTDTFTYKAQDGAGAQSNLATVTITLNQFPVAANDDSFSTNVDTALSSTIAGDVTDDGPAPLTFAVVQNPSHGSVSLSSNGSFTYTPASGYSDTTTPDSFTYKATDGYGAASNVATVSITVYPVITFTDPVNVSDGDVTGTFTLLTDGSEKRYTSGADAEAHTILFQPSGSEDLVDYRGVLSFGPDATSPGQLNGSPLEYDPAGGSNYRALPWCVDPQFDPDGNVTSATIPSGDSWCIAAADTRAGASGFATTIWQVFGHDDPNFRH